MSHAEFAEIARCGGAPSPGRVANVAEDTINRSQQQATKQNSIWDPNQIDVRYYDGECSVQKNERETSGRAEHWVFPASDRNSSADQRSQCRPPENTYRREIAGEQAMLGRNLNGGRLRSTSADEKSAE